MENRQHHSGSLLIALTVLFGMMLVALPLPHALMWWRPAWVFMILLFWLIAIPHRVGIGVAFIVGLLLDLLTGTLFGQHAIIFTLMAYFVLRCHAPIRSLPPWQQTLLVLVLTFVYFALQYWIMALADVPASPWMYWMPVFTTALFWPWIRFLLKDFQQKFKLV